MTEYLSSWNDAVAKPTYPQGRFPGQALGSVSMRDDLKVVLDR